MNHNRLNAQNTISCEIGDENCCCPNCVFTHEKENSKVTVFSRLHADYCTY